MAATRRTLIVASVIAVLSGRINTAVRSKELPSFPDKSWGNSDLAFLASLDIQQEPSSRLRLWAEESLWIQAKQNGLGYDYAEDAVRCEAAVGNRMPGIGPSGKAAGGRENSGTRLEHATGAPTAGFRDSTRQLLSEIKAVQSGKQTAIRILAVVATEGLETIAARELLNQAKYFGKAANVIHLGLSIDTGYKAYLDNEGAGLLRASAKAVLAVAYEQAEPVLYAKELAERLSNNIAERLAPHAARIEGEIFKLYNVDEYGEIIRY